VKYFPDEPLFLLKKTLNNTNSKIISKVLSFSRWAWGFNLQFCVLLGWNLNLPVENTSYYLLALLLQMISYSPSTAIDVWFRRKNQVSLTHWNYFSVMFILQHLYIWKWQGQRKFLI